MSGGALLVAAFLDLFGILKSGSKAKSMALLIVPEILSNAAQDASISSSG